MLVYAHHILEDQYLDLPTCRRAYSLCLLHSNLSATRSLKISIEESGILYTIPIIILQGV